MPETITYAFGIKRRIFDMEAIIMPEKIISVMRSA